MVGAPDPTGRHLRRSGVEKTAVTLAAIQLAEDGQTDEGKTYESKLKFGIGYQMIFPVHRFSKKSFQGNIVILSFVFLSYRSQLITAKF